MAESVELYRSWTVDQLKAFLRERWVPLSGNKEQLVKKVADIVATDDLEGQIQAVPFQRTEYPSPPEFSELSNDLNWTGDGFPLVTENNVTTYLKARDGYTKNFQTGIRLCQCRHLSSLEIARCNDFTYVKAKCRPTMRQVPSYYYLFIKFNATGSPLAGNCKCPAGSTQSCVHIAALLIMLSEITPQACTSVRCAWSRPSQGGKPCFSADLDFGKSSSTGYFPYTGTLAPLDDLIQGLEDAGCDAGILHYFNQESEKNQQAFPSSSRNPVLIDPLDKLCEICANRDVSVSDLVEALRPTAEDVQLIQNMSIGQRNNPLWLDARQWQVTSSNFGRVCNRQFRQSYPSSLIKTVLGDYGTPHSAALQWGCDHEHDAIQQYMVATGTRVEDCGVFLSVDYPFLATSPDGVIWLRNEKFGIVEVKCPYKHRDNSIEIACQDPAFCLRIDGNETKLKRTHDYYYQVIGQLALSGAKFCDFIVWTKMDLHRERILPDDELWSEMNGKLSHFYMTTLGIEILARLHDM